ncbi:MAG: acyl-CoA reductase [Bergeyella sp.]
MNRENQISGLCKIGIYIHNFLSKEPENHDENETEFNNILRKSEVDNPWFTPENQKFALKQWAELLTETHLHQWLEEYPFSKNPKKVGLILAGNIPMVGFHDVISTVLSGHIPVIKLSSKDRFMLPFLMKKWNEFSDGNVDYQFVEKLAEFDAVIATGSNNTARYLEYYFQNHLSIIRKNRTSVAVLKGNESDEEIQKLSEDIFRYFGLGCRNVTRLFIPEDFTLDRLFENFMNFKEVVNHNKYANNYDYNRAVYLLNQEKFWDNNFVLLKEDDALFSPLAVLNFSRYKNIEEVRSFLTEHEKEIQCVVAKPELEIPNSVGLGEAQNPGLDTYADNVNTMQFLQVI